MKVFLKLQLDKKHQESTTTYLGSHQTKRDFNLKLLDESSRLSLQGGVNVGAGLVALGRFCRCKINPRAKETINNA